MHATTPILSFLGWAIVLNFALILVWAVSILAARQFIYRLQTKFVKITEQQFDLLNYGGIGLYKLLTIFFLVMPYLAIRIIT